MFEDFFLAIQQDFKLFLFFPFICAFFRAFFILKYKPYSLWGRWKKVAKCFWFGLWWGMDFNAYVFLLSMVIISLPGLVFPFWQNIGDMLRLVLGGVYATILYIAFVGKMIFYANFHDTFNHILRLGRKAEKHNLLDIFFCQHHGFFCIFEFFPYMVGYVAIMAGLLSLPGYPYPHLSGGQAYAFNAAVVVVLVVGFYFFRYGGTLKHDNKPEWDTIPDAVKDDAFLAKACMDDLVALERVWAEPLNSTLKLTDEENLASIRSMVKKMGGEPGSEEGVLNIIRKTSQGVRIKKPSHIFLIVGESYSQVMFDPAFAALHVADGGKAIYDDPHTAHVETALSAGIISRPSIVSMMLGVFDAGLELNEQESFWSGTLPTSLPLQLKKLGYRSSYWYGGSLAHGNFQHFAKACGFDHIYAGPDICPGAPQSWVGVYDHIFLGKCADMISADTDDTPAFHFVYTTSNHGPYKLPLKKLGYDKKQVMAEAPKDVRNNKVIQKALGTFWYADQAISTFVNTMKEKFPDSLFIITGDHGFTCRQLQDTSFMKREYTFRELHSPVLMFHHRAISQDMLAGNTIGDHMNIMPTLFELIAPRGFEYYSLAHPLTEPIDFCVSPYHWATPTAVGGYDRGYYQDLTVPPGEGNKWGEPPHQDICNAEKSLTGYLLKHPEYLIKREEEEEE